MFLTLVQLSMCQHFFDFINLQYGRDMILEMYPLDYIEIRTKERTLISRWKQFNYLTLNVESTTDGVTTNKTFDSNSMLVSIYFSNQYTLKFWNKGPDKIKFALRFVRFRSYENYFLSSRYKFPSFKLNSDEERKNFLFAQEFEYSFMVIPITSGIFTIFFIMSAIKCCCKKNSK